MHVWHITERVHPWLCCDDNFPIPAAAQGQRTPSRESIALYNGAAGMDWSQTPLYCHQDWKLALAGEHVKAIGESSRVTEEGLR